MSKSHIKITFTGDIMCESSQIAAHKIGGNKYDFQDIFSSIKKYFANSDYVVGNLETPIAGKEVGYANEKWSFNTPIEFIEAIKESGVDLVSTANNHCLDRGVQGLKNTINALDDTNLKHVGTYSSVSTKRYFTEEIEGLKIGFFSYTYGTNAFSNHNYLNKDEKYMVNLFQNQELSNKFIRSCYDNPSKLYSKVFRKIGRTFNPDEFNKPVYERKESSKKFMEQLLCDLKECKESGVDYIIMLMHAGGQYNAEPTKYTVELADFLLKNGVDTVIGNHEHVIHPCNWSKLNQNKVITYSLGNFSGIAGVYKEPYDKMAEYSIIFNLYLAKEDKMIKIDKTTFSIVKSVPLDHEKVKTVLLHDMINECTNKAEKKQLIADNLKIINGFLNVNLDSIENLEEYCIDNIVNLSQ